MGFALWLTSDLAWAQGTHEYKPMGAAVIARSNLFHARDFDRYRRAPDRLDPAFAGLFASLGDVNAHLRSHSKRKNLRARPKRTRAVI